MSGAAAPSIVGGIGTLATSFTQARGERAEGEFRQQQFRANARFAELQAEDAIRRGQIASEEQRLITRRVTGQQRTALAAQGVDVSSGTAAQVQADTAALGALDALNIRFNAAREAFGARVQAAGLRTQARFADVSSRGRARSILAVGGLSAARDFTQAARLHAEFGSSS